MKVYYVDQNMSINDDYYEISCSSPYYYNYSSKSMNGPQDCANQCDQEDTTKQTCYAFAWDSTNNVCYTQSLNTPSLNYNTWTTANNANVTISSDTTSFSCYFNSKDQVMFDNFLLKNKID